MLKTIILFFALLIGGIIYLQQSIEGGKVLHYIDTHAQEKYIPEATFRIGQGYYLFQDLQNSATYFLRVAQRYPQSPLADDAYFGYLQSLDDSAMISRADLIEGYQAYLEKYPAGKHAEIAKTRLGNYQTGAR